MLVIREIIIDCPESYFKKCCNLLLQEHTPSPEFDTLKANAFFDFSHGVRVVQDILPVDCRNCQVFCHSVIFLVPFRRRSGGEGLDGIVGRELVAGEKGFDDRIGFSGVRR